MQASNAFFATARPARLFFTVALPGLISMLAASIYSVIEGAFIGHYLGEAAFAAVNLAMPFVMINFSLADLVGVGSSVPISIALGQKNAARANNYFTCSLILILLASIFMGILLFFASPTLLRLMGAEGQLAVLAVRYVRVYALLSPVTTLIFAMDNYLRICGFVKSSMALNLFLSAFTAFLIFFFLGIQKMNVEGAALATCISMSTCALIALIPFLCKKTLLRLVKPKFSLAMIKQVVCCGTPVFLNNIAGRVASILMNSALLRLGGQTAIAAYSVLMYASGMIEPMLYGMSDSVQPAIGYNWGAKSLPRVKALAKCSFLACGVVSVIGTLCMFFFPSAITSLFVPENDAILFSLAVHAMRLFCLAYLFRWIAFATQGFYSAIEQPLPASVLSICSAMVFPVLFIFLLSPFTLDGLWCNMTASSIAVSCMAIFMLLRSRRTIQSDMEKQKK